MLSLVLLIMAIIVHVRSSNLSLAISPTLSILTILLPIVGFFNTAFYPRILRTTKSSSSNVAKLAPLIVQVLQALVTTILATLLIERAVPSEVMGCMLDKKWMDLAVVLGAGLIQILGLLLTKKDSSWWNNWRNHGRGQTNQHHESRRPLLIDRERDVIEEEEIAHERPERPSQGYGSVRESEQGPRVVPSSVIERNNWTED
ncbi:hypothetical protein IL306_009447 [Fusarium sp. DS 682]|nr:hypothetical protein IL306_009447 [Fusarium sp. DS 682]